MLTTTTERTVLVCSWADPVNNPPELLGKPDFTGCSHDPDCKFAAWRDDPSRHPHPSAYIEVPVSEVPASCPRCMYCGGGR